jgi:hypothetical protein
MDMTKYSGPRFVKPDDVRDDPIEGRIAGVKEGKFGKPDLFLDSGQVLSLNSTNNRILMKAYGTNSDLWIAKMIRMLLGEIEYQGSPHESVVVEPISPPIKKKETKETDSTSAPKPVPDMDDEIPL